MTWTISRGYAVVILLNNDVLYQQLDNYILNAPSNQAGQDDDKVKYIITGGAGFIGSHIAEMLVRRGDDVTVIDNFFSGKK